MATEKKKKEPFPSGKIFAPEREVELKSNYLAGKKKINTGAEEAEMVQVFMVVRCYSCETFQVHQV